MIPGATAISDVAISALPEWAGSFLAESVVALSDASQAKIYAATRELKTRAGDTPANQPFLGTLRKTISITRSLKSGSGYGGLQMTLGDIELENAEADYDEIETDYAVDGATVTIKVLEDPGIATAVLDYSSAHTIGVFVAKSKSADEEVFRVKLIDQSFRLDVPAQPQVYGGAGNLDGSTEVAGKRKPWALGHVEGVTPAPVIPSELVYQVSWRSVQAISAVYDSGVALDATSDYATSNLLRAASLSPGEFATCLAEGLFRLGGVAFGPVTADVQGDDDGTFAETTAAIVRLLVQDGGDLDDDEIADNAFDLLDLQQPAEIGYFLGHESNETVSQAVIKLMDAIGGVAGFSRLGLFEVALIDAPSIVPTGRYSSTDVLDIVRQPLPDVFEPPPHRFRVMYQRNWTVLTQVAGEEEDSERVAYLQSPGKVAATADEDGAGILVDHPNALDPDPIEAYFRDEADALAEAERRLALYGVRRAEYVVTLGTHPFVHDVLENIHVTRPRFDLTGGKMLRVVEVRDQMSPDGDTQTIVGFG